MTRIIRYTTEANPEAWEIMLVPVEFKSIETDDLVAEMQADDAFNGEVVEDYEITII